MEEIRARGSEPGDGSDAIDLEKDANIEKMISDFGVWIRCRGAEIEEFEDATNDSSVDGLCQIQRGDI